MFTSLENDRADDVFNACFPRFSSGRNRLGTALLVGAETGEVVERSCRRLLSLKRRGEVGDGCGRIG